VNDDAVGIKSIEHAIIDRAWAEGWVQARARPSTRPARKWPWWAPARPAWRRRSSWRAWATTSPLFEKNDRVGGLLRYGIPDFKMEKSHIDRRVEQMQAEGVTFRTGVMVGKLPKAAR
jgi:glutamate synthase (NADPH/NADH) small chain